jgi:hypothetical protein
MRNVAFHAGGFRTGRASGRYQYISHGTPGPEWADGNSRRGRALC